MKELSQVKNYLNDDTLVLKRIDVISSSDDKILLDLRELYQDIDTNTDHHFKACLTILTSCIQQKRHYFLLSRLILKNLILGNKNIPKKYRKTFDNKHYNTIIELLVTQYGIMEKLTSATKKKAALYKLKHEQTIDYLNSKEVLTEIQEEKVKLFLENTKVLKKNTDKYNIRDKVVLKRKG